MPPKGKKKATARHQESPRQPECRQELPRQSERRQEPPRQPERLFFELNYFFRLYRSYQELDYFLN